jgi:hypothetical protein
MIWLTEAFNSLGALLLQIVIGLLIEELTFAGLARLVLASRAGAKQDKKRNHSGENPCSH